MKPIVKFDNVYKTYSFYKNQSEKMLDILSIKKKKRSFSALRGVSFEVFRGESIGVIGINGSGKSTLSNLLAQVVMPSSGEIDLKGEPSLIAISAGLNNNLSGLENIRLKCLMLGLKNEEITNIIPDILEFADIGDFINQPVKNYSSGMKSRLGFAISIHTDPDILIIDEALSVGDQTFYEKCLKKMEDFKSQGKTIFFISHSVSQVRTFCDRVLWLHFGEIQRFGEKTEVLNEYKEFINWFNSLTEKEKKEFRTKKLQEQFVENSYKASEMRRFRKQKSKKKFPTRSLFFALQSLFLLLMLTLSLLLMFTNQDLSTFVKNIPLSQVNASNVSNAGEKPTENVENVTETINKSGRISRESVPFYSDNELTSLFSTLTFGSPITIVEKRTNSYLINYRNNSGYIKIDDATISDMDAVATDYNLTDLFDLMPDTFTRSYQFYLAHIGVDYDQVKNNIRGLTEELVDEAGNKTQVYSASNVAYLFDETNTSNKIKILNVNVESMLVESLEKNSIIKNPEENMFYTAINNYEIIVDKKERSMILKTQE
jgi:teichoic acid transport system ATP-binding protein